MSKIKESKEWINKLYYGDNLDIIRRFIDNNSIDLCYIDPPFNSKRNYNQIYNNTGSEDKAQAQAFIDTWTWDDPARDGLKEIKDNEKNRFPLQTIRLIEGLENVLGQSSLFAYIISMSLRIVEIRRVLKTTGSFYLHCDPTASHYLKLVCDSIFCPSGGDFINEIIWRYRRWSNAARNYQRMHDVILFYSKTDDYIFNVQYQEYAKPETIENTVRGFVGGKLVRLKDKKGNYIKRGKENIGVPCHDVFEIQHLQPTERERLGYPTQKPERLLERIIQTSSNEGDVVLDAYCGCGTTVAVAEKLQRKWIGIDITYQSISLILYRLEKSYTKKIKDSIELSGVPEDIKSAIALANKKEDKTRKEFEKWCVLTYSDNKAMINEKKGKDSGIDGIALMKDYKGKDDNIIEFKNVYFSVKSDKKPHVSYIRDFHGTIQRDKAAFGIFISLYEPTKDMIDECKKLGNYQCNIIDKKYPIIKIVTVEEILKGERLEIPLSHQTEVVKTAELKKDDSGQGKLFKTTDELF